MTLCGKYIAAIGQELWVPDCSTSLTMDRALTVAGVEQIVEVDVAAGQVWANIGEGKLAHLPAPKSW